MKSNHTPGDTDRNAQPVITRFPHFPRNLSRHYPNNNAPHCVYFVNSAKSSSGGDRSEALSPDGSARHNVSSLHFAARSGKKEKTRPAVFRSPVCQCLLPAKSLAQETTAEYESRLRWRARRKADAAIPPLRARAFANQNAVPDDAGAFRRVCSGKRPARTKGGPKCLCCAPGERSARSKPPDEKQCAFFYLFLP